MSLKAKIEAVIYASEEPVTLAQLAGLLGQEAQAELDHLESAQQSLALDQSTDETTRDQTGEATTADEAAAPLPEADIEGATGPIEGATAQPTEPEPTDSAPSSEPEPTESSPIPEHPAASPEAAAEKSARDQKLDEKLRERKLRDYFRSILDELIADYARESNDRGLEIREVASGFRLSTKPQYHDTVRGFVKSLKPPLKLSLQALETLAVVAYKQPVTAPEVSEIRGVDSGGVLGSLMARKLVTTAGRKQVIGRPILYKTTRDFLLRFGLKDIQELPSIEEFEKMAGELAETFAEPVQEEIPMPEHPAPESPEPGSPEAAEQEKNAVQPQADGATTPENAPASSQGEADAYSPAASDEQAIGTAADEVLIDGRLSGLPPNYDTDTTPEGADSPALDAEIQRDAASEED
ncbi:MAG TPA: SMC-Scp complex subunit ScpB [Granulicella sp.]|nr:SMC-Scp complex subunit ScpB [Granulicella sp.]